MLSSLIGGYLEIILTMENVTFLLLQQLKCKVATAPTPAPYSTATNAFINSIFSEVFLNNKQMSI